MRVVLPKTRDEKGNVCYIILDGVNEILVDVDDYKEAIDMNLKRTTIIKQAKKGRRSFKLFLNECEKGMGVRRLIQEDREREERKRALAEEKQRKEQERLQMIKDAKCSSRWFKEMSEKHLVAKLKTDKYGNQQLI